MLAGWSAKSFYVKGNPGYFAALTILSNTFTQDSNDI